MPKTSVAVGCAVGIPCAVVFFVSLFFWWKSSRKFKKEARDEEGLDDYDKDMDLTSIYVRGDAKKLPAVDPSTGDELSIRENTSDGNKVSSIMDNSDGTKNSATDVSSAQAQTPTPRLYKSRGSFMSFYDSVIPVLPASGTVSSSSPNESSHQLPRTPERVPSTQQLQTVEFIRQLNKNDSSSFPITTQTLVNATPSTLNLFNNYQQRSSSTLTSRNNSTTALNGLSQDGLTGQKAYPKTGTRVTSVEGYTSSPKNEQHEQHEQHEEKRNDEQHEDREEQPHSLLDGTLLSTAKDSPFDTPPRNRSSHVFVSDEED